MARATSYNYEIEVNGQTIQPLKIGGFSEGEEGRIEVADGSRKYRVRNQIFDIGEIEVEILMTKRLGDYNIMQDWCLNGRTQNCSIIGRDAAGVRAVEWLLTDCEVAMGKKNDFDRNSKAIDTKKYFLLPLYIDQVYPTAGAIQTPRLPQSDT